MSSNGSTGSLYGQDILNFIQNFTGRAGPAHEAAQNVLTHGFQYPLAQAIGSLGFIDRALFHVFEDNPWLTVTPEPPAGHEFKVIRMYANSLGRLHIRNAEEDILLYDANDHFVEVGYVHLTEDLWLQAQTRFAGLLAAEDQQYARLSEALNAEAEAGNLMAILEQVIDHVEHVESVCFYVGDAFYARIDRFVNLIQGKGVDGFLPKLRGKEFGEWSRDEILVVASLHALFLSGRSVRFEEFNGMALTATAVCGRLEELSRGYRAAGCDAEAPVGAGMFQFAQFVREQSLQSEGRDWLRYRWIYGINFQKNERMLSSLSSSESANAGVQEFGQDYADLVGKTFEGQMTEGELFRALAMAALHRDRQGVPCLKGSPATTGWIEYLMEKVVASAVMATRSDYGMSSSLRDISRLVVADDEALLIALHELQTNDFFTCFVSKGFGAMLDPAQAEGIAQSVQRRMMFNRWHFIPGSLKRSQIVQSRHWYYPPVLPDIAIHSDVHRAAHARAQVKYSIRAPGPDASRPPLLVAARPYRGFYDVRVVRMIGPEFTTEELLRTRRRTLWLESIYAVLVSHVESGNRRPVAGFQPGQYLDLEEIPAATEKRRPGKHFAH